MNNEPVAWMFEYGTDRGDAVNGISWYPNVHFKKPDLRGLIRNIEPLYTHPAQELNDGGEPVKNATYWKRQYNQMWVLNDRLKSSLYHANEQIKYLEFHPEDLTDEEIHKIAQKHFHVGLGINPLDFARAILKKAGEK